jgi:hypothetical protein
MPFANFPERALVSEDGEQIQRLYSDLQEALVWLDLVG